MARSGRNGPHKMLYGASSRTDIFASQQYIPDNACTKCDSDQEEATRDHELDNAGEISVENLLDDSDNISDNIKNTDNIRKLFTSMPNLGPSRGGTSVSKFGSPSSGAKSAEKQREAEAEEKTGSQSMPVTGKVKEDPPVDVPDVSSGSSSGLADGVRAEHAENTDNIRKLFTAMLNLGPSRGGTSVNKFGSPSNGAKSAEKEREAEAEESVGAQSMPATGMSKEDPPADVPDVASGPSTGLADSVRAENAETREKQKQKTE